MARYLEIPWEDSRYLMRQYGDLLKPQGGGIMRYSGDGKLPANLAMYATEDFSYARWLEDDERLRTGQRPILTRTGPVQFTPRDHQKEAIRCIGRAYEQQHRGFLLGDKTGVGKTLSALGAVTYMAHNANKVKPRKRTLLVVCPKAVIPVWRQTIQAYSRSTSLLRIMVINYQQLGKLLKAPPKTKEEVLKEREEKEKLKTASSRKKKSAARKEKKDLSLHGVPTVDWDFIIFDESHYLKNFPSSTMSRQAATIARLEEIYHKGSSPFVLFSTATPGSSPLNFAIMAGVLGPLLDKGSLGRTVTPKGWGRFLYSQKFHVTEGKKDQWSWVSMPWGSKANTTEEKRKQAAAELRVKKLQRADSMRIGRALTSPNAPFLMRAPKDIAGWPEQQFIPLPLELSSKERPLYEEAWSAFRDWLNLQGNKKDPKGALVQRLRYRQKASLLKVGNICEFIAEQVEEGKQVFVSVEFMETLDRFKENLSKRGIETAEVSGRVTGQERTKERLRFQRGEAKVVLCTVVEGVSFHSGESLPDGTKATDAPRITIIADTRQNDLSTLQAAGRCHRDGQNSLTYIPYFIDTADEIVVKAFANKADNGKLMTGESVDGGEGFDHLISTYRKMQ